MALTPLMSPIEMKRFLDEELKDQVLLEIAPILHLGQNSGGYFGVSRQILCLVEFLAALYCGYDESKDKRFKDTKGKGRKIVDSTKVEHFIREFMGVYIDPNYKVNGLELYKMYRHGLVHLYQPKEFRLSGGGKLSWMPYKGSRELKELEVGGFKFTNVRHIGKVSDPRTPGSFVLAVSINCLYNDFIKTIDLYGDQLLKDINLQHNWMGAASAICEAEEL